MLIRDPVHGDIALTALEQQVLDLPEIQRLRGIKQLGTASLVYPGCVHTRFDHSLGVNALSKRIIATVRESGTTVEPETEQLIGVAALLHDVTHVPFGHTLEDERRLFPRHDKGTRFVTLLEGPLGERLAALGLKGQLTALLAIDRAAALAAPAWQRQIIASTIDADLLDYLRRDAYFAGLAPHYDARVFRYFTADRDQLVINMTKHGMERPDARSETVQLLRLRYFLTERVYYHHTKVAAGAMISKAVELAHEHGALVEDELLRLNDWGLLQRLQSIPNPERPDARIVRLVVRLVSRRLLKRGYVISALSVAPDERRRLVERFHESAGNRREAEEILARELGTDTGEVIVYCPALTVMKEAAALVRTPAGLVALNASDDPSNSEIKALEARYAALWRFYVFVPETLVRRAAEAARALFGYPSEHHGESS
jgi:HD superfamily phosphohydrolase